ncbi:MAG: YihY/virulence factor BrkB family protein [Nocardioides sp.]
MPSLKQRVTARVDRFRARHPKVDHVLAMLEHYGKVNGNAQAGAVTFFGFLSFFPILALAFFGVGLLAQVYPELRADIRVEIENLLPGVVGGGPGEIPLKTFEDYGATVGGIGLVAVLYSGLGWLSGMRTALETLFVLPPREQPNFVVGKLRDVATLLLIGLTMVVSVALSGLVAGFSESVLGWFGIGSDGVVPNILLWLVSHGLAIAASTALLLTLFTLLAQPHVPRRSLLDGAILGAIGFEVLKGVAYFLIAQTKSQPAFQAFGVALVLVVWINYFSRLVLYAASYAYTSPAAARQRQAESVAVAAESTPVGTAGEAAAPPDGVAAAGAGAAMDLPVVSVPAAAARTVAAPAIAAPTALAAGVESADGPARRGPVVAGAAVVAAGAAALAVWRRGRMDR